MERQREVIEQWAAMHGHRIVGWAVDVDVSRSVDPFDTPEFGKWFTDEYMHSWDGTAGWKLDRIATGSIYLNKVMDWCGKHDKSLVSVTESFDLSTWVGRMVANVIAGVAEGELEAIKERTRDSRRKLAQIGRWAGGQSPYGYMPEKRQGGWWLVPDPEARRVLNDIVSWVMEGQGVTTICRTLNEQRVPTPSDRNRILQGKPTKGLKWQPGPLKRMLESTALLGHQTSEGRTVRDAEGAPVLIGEPVIGFEEHQAVLAELNKRFKPQQRRVDASALLGVGMCYFCGKNLHHSSDNGRRSYRCSDLDCKDRAPLEAGTLEERAELAILDEIADVPEMTRRFKPGNNTGAAVAEALQGIEELTQVLKTVNNATVRKSLTEQIQALDARVTELESQPETSDSWEYFETGKTYGERWAELGRDDRRKMLINSGIKIYAGRAKRDPKVRGSGVSMFRVEVPHDILSRMSK